MDFSIVAYALPFLLIGAKTTLVITAFGLVLGLPLGVLVGLARVSEKTLLRGFCNSYCAVFRGTPMLVQIFVVYYGLAGVSAIRHNPIAWWMIGDGLHAAILTIVLNSGAYTAETFRSAFLSVPRGAIEAAEACGMSPWHVFARVRFPLALRQALPAYSSEVAVLVKESSLASTITVLEITGYAKRLMSETFAILDIFIVTAGVYLAISVVALVAMKAFERRLTITS